ncbi:MAG TPA: carotenoid oxygenase family protein [Casimicrobiaceae bacterium]|nr:carotenoid oxygenase family protein [Casimicrobiaceae bacterium]
MSRPFPKDDPFLAGNFAPLGFEADAHDLVIRGELPRGLEGALYRNGANPQFAPRGRYHWFDGDGMIHGFFFENGRVSYRNRWVRTEKWQRERVAGESLFGGLSDMTATHESVSGVSGNTANTNIVWHAGRLLALWEGGLPTELDPVTLETRGTWDFAGRFGRRNHETGIMTAHPKLDPQTGEMLMFGYSAIDPFLVYNVVDANGALVKSVEIEVPWASMMHDFITTSEHVIFPVFPVVFDLAAIANGGSVLSWQPERGTKLGVMPRHGTSRDVRWFDTEPCFVFHAMNAHTDGARVICDVAQTDVVPLFAEGGGPPNLTRWTIDLARGDVRQERLDDVPIEFPRLDERYTGLRYAHGYAGGVTRERKGAVMFDSILHYNVQTGSRSAHVLPEHTYTGEPVFVPLRANAPEGEGVLLATIYREPERTSALLVLDAENVEKEPLATIELDTRVPFGFHGNWRSARS